MTPMSIGTSREVSPVEDWWIYRKRSGVLIVIGSSLLLLVILPMLLATSPSTIVASSQSPRPDNLPYLLSMALVRAQDAGELQPIATATPTSIMDKDFEFILSYRVTSSAKPAASETSTKDPLSLTSMPPSMIIAPIAPAHTLVLNKFPTISGHALLLTNRFEPQKSPLTSSDLSAWYYAVATLRAIGFYNSDITAGASQHHKHLQLLPRASLREYGQRTSEMADVPLEDTLRRLRPAWPVFCPVKYMMVVPRSERVFGDEVCDVNGMGLLLARDRSASDIVQHEGPMSILDAVTVIP